MVCGQVERLQILVRGGLPSFECVCDLATENFHIVSTNLDNENAVEWGGHAVMAA